LQQPRGRSLRPLRDVSGLQGDVHFINPCVVAGSRLGSVSIVILILSSISPPNYYTFASQASGILLQSAEQPTQNGGGRNLQTTGPSALSPAYTAWTDVAPTGPSPYGASAFPLRPSDNKNACHDGRLQRHRVNDYHRRHSGGLEPTRDFP